MIAAGEVTVEFYGIPRLRAGRSELAVLAGTLWEVLTSVERTCPGLTGLVQPEGRIAAHYLLSINGERFAGDLHERVTPGERLLLLSADAGG